MIGGFFGAGATLTARTPRHGYHLEEPRRAPWRRSCSRTATLGSHGRGPIWESAHEDPLQRSAIRGMDAAADSHYRRGAPRSARSRRRRRASPKATATPGIANGRRPPTDCMPRPRDAPRAVRGSARATSISGRQRTTALPIRCCSAGRSIPASSPAMHARPRLLPAPRRCSIRRPHRRIFAEGFSRDQQGGRRRDRLQRRLFQENLPELPAVPRVDHELERHCRTRSPE